MKVVSAPRETQRVLQSDCTRGASGLASLASRCSQRASPAKQSTDPKANPRCKGTLLDKPKDDVACDKIKDPVGLSTELYIFSGACVSSWDLFAALASSLTMYLVVFFVFYRLCNLCRFLVTLLRYPILHPAAVAFFLLVHRLSSSLRVFGCLVAFSFLAICFCGCFRFCFLLLFSALLPSAGADLLCIVFARGGAASQPIAYC